MHVRPAPPSTGLGMTGVTVPCKLYTAHVHYADKYILFDCPGQVELFSHHGSLRNIITQMMKGGKYQVGAWLAHGGACFLWCTVTPPPPRMQPHDPHPITLPALYPSSATSTAL